MTHALSVRDLSAAMQCLGELYALTDAAELPMRMLRALSSIVPCKLTAFTEVDPVLRRSTARFFPAEPWSAEEAGARLQEDIHEHPVIQYVQRTRDGQANAISDFLSVRQFHATRLYQVLFGPMGIEDQLSVAMVGSSGLMIGLSFNRGKRGFGDRDRAILNLLRPHLLQAYLNCREFQQLQHAHRDRRGSVFDQLPLGLICINTQGGIIWSTEPVRQMLADHFPDAADSIHGLPDALRIWIKRQSSAARGESSVSNPMVSRRSGFELRLRFCPLKQDQAILLLQQHPLVTPEPSLEQYGLTRREEDVMQCLLRGEGVAEAAGRLSISGRTVQKHLERIFQKLGVNSRSAACVKVLGSGKANRDGFNNFVKRQPGFRRGDGVTGDAVRELG